MDAVLTLIFLGMLYYLFVHPLSEEEKKLNIIEEYLEVNE